MITGKDIYDIYTSITQRAQPWEALESPAQRNYGEMAAQLNGGHITPLQREIEQLKAEQQQTLALARQALIDVEQLVHKFNALKEAKCNQ